MTLPHSISKLEHIRLGDVEQGIRIQGKGTSNPVLLLVQQGPRIAPDQGSWRGEEAVAARG